MVAYSALVLAAGRGPDDPMAKAYGVANKSTIPIAGIPMLRRVVTALEESGCVRSIAVSIEKPELAKAVIGESALTLAPAGSAPASVMKAVKDGLPYPLLITTGDHALLTADMVRYFCQSTEKTDAGFTVGLATAETILAAYPQSVRTFFRLDKDRVSGCNLFILRDAAGLKLLERWQYLEQVRKKPWRLVAAFGLSPLFRYLTGTLDLATAMRLLSKRLGCKVQAILMPFAEAAIDVDKPADKELAEEILAKRR